MNSPLEPDAKRMREMGDTVLARVIEQLATARDRPPGHHDPDAALEEARRIHELPLPEQGESLDKILDHLFGTAMPLSYNTAHPGFLAYVPIGGIYEGALADLIAATMSRYVGRSHGAPVLAQIEATTIDWLREIVGLRTGGGVLTSGGSLAQLSAVVAAREEKLDEDDRRRAVIYLSDQTHHSFPKAAAIAGFRPRQLRTIPTDPEYRIDTAALQTAIEQDRRAGLKPFIIVGNAGTTNTGAVDDLRTLATIAHTNDLWYHIDAAYGGTFAATERGRQTLAGIEQADSITLDPHKGLFLPIGTGALLVKDTETLRRAHAMHGDYMPPQTGQIPDFDELGPELTRPFRGLRLWLALKHNGMQAFRRQLDEKLDLTNKLADALEATPGIKLTARPKLTTLAFAHQDPAKTQQLLDRINAQGRIHLATTNLRGTQTIRVCILNPSTHQQDIQHLLDDLHTALRDTT